MSVVSSLFEKFYGRVAVEIHSKKNHKVNVASVIIKMKLEQMRSRAFLAKISRSFGKKKIKKKKMKNFS